MTSELIKEYILYDSKHSIIICRQCKYALIPGENIKRHFQNLHQSISLPIRKEIIGYCDTLTLLPLKEVITPEPDNGPVDGLELYSNGWKCIYENCTGYLSASENLDSMIFHCRTTHKWMQNDGVKWVKFTVQTFFQGKNVKFFEVNVEKQQRFSLNVLLHDVLEEANQRDEEHHQTLNHVMESHIVTKTPWLL